MRAPPLPKSDFISNFEKKFLTYPEHIAHRLAFESMEDGYELPRKVRVSQQAESLKNRYTSLWNSLNIRSVGRSSLFFMIAPVLRNRLIEQFDIL